MSQTVSAISVNPTLESALGNLELDLESELRRYRRQAIAAGQRPEHLPQPAAPVVEDDATKQSKVVDVVADSPSTSSQSFEDVALPTPENPANHSPEVAQVLEALKQGGGDTTDKELLNLENRDVLPQDYLDSSEELLKTLEREDESETKEDKAKTIKWTPIKVALVGVGIVGVIGLLTAILFPNVFNPSASQDATELDASGAAEVGAEEIVSTSAPTTVNLASEEFQDLSLDNLSVVDPDEEVAIAPTEAAPTASESVAPQTPSVVPNPGAVPETLVPPTGRENLASALLPPSLRPQPVNPFPTTPQTLTAQPTNGQTLVTPDGLKVGYYYVIFRNTSAEALTRAQGEVSDAFVRTFPTGRVVQLAEVSTADTAESLVQKFKGNQIAAEIYHHQLTPAP